MGNYVVVIALVGPKDADFVTAYVANATSRTRTTIDARFDTKWTEMGIKKPLIRQAGSAVSLCRFYCHWQRTSVS